MAPARDRRTGFSRRRQYGVFASYVLAVAGVVVGGVLLVVSALNPHAFGPPRMAVASLTAPISAALATVVAGAAALPDEVADHFRVRGENARLRAELVAARRLIARARAIHYDNRRLRRLLDLRDRGEQAVTTARLVSSSASSTRRFAVLNAGTWSGVSPGMPVRGPDGLIGRVVEAGPAAARVLLLGDPDSIVPVRRTRDGLPALVAGRGDGRLEVRSVNAADAGFRADDLFVTTGAGGLYAPGIAVAAVERPGRDSAPARATAIVDALDFATVERPFFPVPAPAAAPATVPAPTEARR